MNLSFVTTAVGLAAAVFEFLNDKRSKTYIQEIKTIKEEILKEEQKGYDADDAKIEHLYKRMEIVMDAAKQELTLKQAKG